MYPNWVYNNPNVTGVAPYQMPYSVPAINWSRTNQSNLLKVTGPESAKSYPIGANSSVVLFDANDAVFYLKTTDDSGFASLRTFDFVERTEPIDVKPVDPGYATKDDLDGIRKQLSDISEALKGLV
jgi:hypothetical protein